MPQKIIGIFDRRLLIWFHYIPLLMVLGLAYWLASLIGLLGLISNNSIFIKIIGWILVFIWFYIFASIGDQLIHAVLGVD